MSWAVMIYGYRYTGSLAVMNGQFLQGKVFAYENDSTWKVVGCYEVTALGMEDAVLRSPRQPCRQCSLRYTIYVH